MKTLVEIPYYINNHGDYVFVLNNRDKTAFFKRTVSEWKDVTFGENQSILISLHDVRVVMTQIEPIEGGVHGFLLKEEMINVDDAINHAAYLKIMKVIALKRMPRDYPHFVDTSSATPTVALVVAWDEDGIKMVVPQYPAEVRTHHAEILFANGLCHRIITNEGMIYFIVANSLSIIYGKLIDFNDPKMKDVPLLSSVPNEIYNYFGSEEKFKNFSEKCFTNGDIGFIMSY